MPLNRLAPAAAQCFANQALHGRHGLRARIVGEGFHGHGYIADDHGVVHRYPQAHVVDGLVGLPGTLAFNRKCIGLGIYQFTFNVPKSILAEIALVSYASCVLQCAWMRSGKRQFKSF